MSKREEFIAFINTLKTVSPAITDEQRIGLLRQAQQQYGLTVDAATEILKASGLVVGEGINYFEVLELSIAEIQNQSETGITNLVETAHKKRYSASLRAGARLRPDGKTEEQWRMLLNEARDTLIDAKRRREHILWVPLCETFNLLNCHSASMCDCRGKFAINCFDSIIFI